MSTQPTNSHDASTDDDQGTTDRPEVRQPDNDPRTNEIQGEEGIPGPLIDTPHNMPGDQPEDATGPDKSQLEGTRPVDAD